MTKNYIQARGNSPRHYKRSDTLNKKKFDISNKEKFIDLLVEELTFEAMKSQDSETACHISTLCTYLNLNKEAYISGSWQLPQYNHAFSVHYNVGGKVNAVDLVPFWRNAYELAAKKAWKEEEKESFDRVLNQCQQNADVFGAKDGYKIPDELKLAALVCRIEELEAKVREQ